MAEPNEDFGFVTRFAVTVREFDSPTGAPIGTAEVALIRCADAMNKGVSISAVLDEDSEELTALYGVFFEDNSLKEEYENGVGFDVLYFETLELYPDWRDRKIEEAIVRRVFDVWGAGCAIGVMALASPDEFSRWNAMGFELVENAEGATSANLFVFMDLSLRQPMVVEADEHTFQLAEAPRLEVHVGADDFEHAPASSGMTRTTRTTTSRRSPDRLAGRCARELVSLDVDQLETEVAPWGGCGPRT